MATRTPQRVDTVPAPLVPTPGTPSVHRPARRRDGVAALKPA